MASTSRKKAKNTLPIAAVLAAAAILLFIAVLTNNRPNTDKVDLQAYFSSSNGEMAVIRDDELTHEDFRYENGALYISVDYLQEKLNPRFYYDETEKRLLYTLPDGTREADASTQLDGKAVLWTRSGTTYVLLDYAAQFTAVTWELFDTPMRLVMRTRFGEQGRLTARTQATVRRNAAVTSPIMTFLEEGQEAVYLEELADWYFICTTDGIHGYVSKEEVSEPVITVLEAPYREPACEMVTDEQDRLVIWQQISYISDNGALKELMKNTKGITTIVPTWLFLIDGEGNFASSADTAYVAEAHEMGLDVWILLNNMDYEIYGETLCRVFNVTASRRKLINGVMTVLRETGADGINVDIESLPASGGRGFLQFIRELCVAAHAEGYVVSVDNYVPSAWTAHYGRTEQAAFADYLIVMGYDEHYAGSEAGPTASLDFVIKGVEDSLKQIPAHKLIWGVPFFTRLWLGSGKDLHSRQLPMNEIPQLTEKYGFSPAWDTDLGQYYAEFVMDGETARIWIEDEESMQLRLNSLRSYDLAGLAAWRLGMESNNIWTVIGQFLGKD